MKNIPSSFLDLNLSLYSLMINVNDVGALHNLTQSLMFLSWLVVKQPQPPPPNFSFSHRSPLPKVVFYLHEVIYVTNNIQGGIQIPTSSIPFFNLLFYLYICDGVFPSIIIVNSTKWLIFFLLCYHSPNSLFSPFQAN